MVSYQWEYHSRIRYACCYRERHVRQGRIQRLKKGGTYRVGLVRPCHARSASYFFSLRTYNAQHQSRRFRGHAPLGKFKFRPHERPSETTVTTQNVWQLYCNSGDSSYSRFSEPLSLRNQLLYVRHCHRIRVFYVWRTWSRDLSRDVRCVRVATCAKARGKPPRLALETALQSCTHR